MWWIFLTLLILGGCIGGSDQQPTNSKVVKEDNNLGTIEIISEEEDTGEQEENVVVVNDSGNYSFDWGYEEESPEDVINFSFKPDDPIYVRFFDVGLPESRKQGRLIQIRRGDLDIFIWSVPEEMFGKAYGYIKSYSDDIEYLIIPSPRPVNTEALDRLLNKTTVGQMLAPHTMSLPYNVTYLKEGDTLELANFTLRVWKAGERGFQTDGDKGLILSLDTEYGRFLFLLDAETGLFRKLVSDYGSQLKTQYFSWNTYGGILEPNTYQLFLSMSNPKHMIADGAPYAEYDAEGGSRDGIYNRVSIFGVNYTRVWDHSFVMVVLDNRSYVRGG